MIIKKNQKGSSLIELIVTVAIASSLVATMAPMYINSLESSKVVADEIVLKDAVNLASAMYVMKDIKTQVMYYSPEGELLSSKYGINAYGQTKENENSIVMVYIENDAIKAKWITK